MDTIIIKIMFFIASYALMTKIVCSVLAYVFFCLFVMAAYLRKFTAEDSMKSYVESYNQDLLNLYKSGEIDRKTYSKQLMCFEKDTREADILCMVFSPIAAIPCGIRLLLHYVRYFVRYISCFIQPFD